MGRPENDPTLGTVLPSRGQGPMERNKKFQVSFAVEEVLYEGLCGTTSVHDSGKTHTDRGGTPVTGSGPGTGRASSVTGQPVRRV